MGGGGGKKACLVNKDKQKEKKKKKYFIYQSMTHQSSFILFWRMVPVRPMRTLHFKDFIVWVIWDFGFLILCTSSTMTADHSILHSKKKYSPLIGITYHFTYTKTDISYMYSLDYYNKKKVLIFTFLFHIHCTTHFFACLVNSIIMAKLHNKIDELLSTASNIFCEESSFSFLDTHLTSTNPTHK